MIDSRARQVPSEQHGGNDSYGRADGGQAGHRNDTGAGQVEAGNDGEGRDARAESRDARDVLEQGEVAADTERRDARDVLEQGEVTADTERRDAREAKERKERLQAQAQRLESL